jgi:hypothetical protein
MKMYSTIRPFNTDKIVCRAVLLTLILLLWPRLLHAQDQTTMTPMPLINDRPSNSVLADADRSARLHQLVDYMRQQGPLLVPGLPNTLQGPSDFLMSQFRSVEDGLGMNGEETESGGSLASFLSPVFSLMHPADETIPEALWLSPGYHHTHGMLPFKDAVTFGVNYRNLLLDDRVKMSIHPFYAQSWHGTDDYWGVETALGMGPGAGKPWGTIVVRYTNGNENLMDQGHGIDMRANLAFSEHVDFTAGAQQSDRGDIGNYALIKWHAEFGQ